MILRSVMQHVRDQNWVAVWIDFLIVVVGVFIGIQVANWNEARNEARLGEAYEQRLSADLSEDLVMLQTQLDYYSTVLDSIVLTEALLQEDAPDPSQLIIHAYRATEVHDSVANHATWDQIVSAGHIGLISEAARMDLMEYFAFQASRADLESLNASSYRERVRGLLPIRVQQALRAGCSDIVNETGNITGFMPTCELDAEPELVREAADRLRADATLRIALGYQFSQVSNFVSNNRGTIVLVQQALRALRRAQPEARIEDNDA